MARDPKTVSNVEKTPCAYIKIHGEEMGPFTFPQIRGWVAREELPEYVPARRPDDQVFVALCTLPEWKEPNPKVDTHVPPINKAPKVVVKRLDRPLGDAPKKTMTVLLILLLLCSVGGVLLKLFVYDRHARMFETGRAAFLQADMQGAVESFQELADDLYFFEIFMRVKVALNQGVAHMELNENDLAREQFDQVPEMIYVTKANTNLCSAALLIVRGELEEAEKILKPIAEADPDKLMAHHLLAECLRKRSRNPEYARQARSMYNGLAHQFSGFLYRLKLGDAYLTSKNFEQSAGIYQSLIRDGFLSERVHMQLGRAYLELGQQNLAIEQFKKAKQINAGIGVILDGQEVN